jgi:hypothetical protein
MFLRSISAALAGCVLLLAPAASTAADRGPSTTEERKQALDIIQRFQADPLDPALKQEQKWVVQWMMEIPDVHVDLCAILDKLPKGDKKDGLTLFTAMIFAQTAFVLRNPHKQDDQLAQYQAGVEGVLQIYEVLLKAKPKDRQSYLDDLIERRAAGTLVQLVKERADVACHK